MLVLSRNIEKIIGKALERQIVCCYTTAPEGKTEIKEQFRILNLRHVKGQIEQRKPPRKPEVLPPRTDKMPIDQDWGNVWPGPRSFHPAVVPLPIRQGFVEKGAPPGKIANAELMKIPNFLHLTPPVIKRQCEAIKKFCAPWPKDLETDEKCEKHFPIEVISSDYCHSSPTIRDPLSRIVSVRFKLSYLELNERAKDKFLRLIGDKYNEDTDTVTIIADRCPLRHQNYDYAMYVITACYHEAWTVEPWEELKTEADMEYYDWNNNASKKSIEAIFGKPSEEIPNIEEYSTAVSNLMNEGESEYTVSKYGEAVRTILGLHQQLKAS